ncbi:MAG: isoprenylcysteine carboxylmethyltransferase family protein [Xanthomonadales bacterium]|nr:isoprenylcysteine carboxylmethyltransferase family protein [Gammaproteobacteria bacterium]NNK51512.1 isoprenylcysteine carboxylmethyltransferase family protein [Xanthomonadales bacterium]
MDTGTGPVYLAMFAVWCYWLGVAVMGLRARLQGTRNAGLLPGQVLEKLMWIAWVPVIAGWILFPWFTLSLDDVPWQLPPVVLEGIFWPGLRWLAAAAAWLCFAATIFCWRWMGTNWRVAVTPDAPGELITGGPFSRVRHPIYALSITMIWCTSVAAPSWPLLVAALMHTILMNLKARNEEQWMLQAHGQAYSDYQRGTNRFLPFRAIR